MSDSIENPFAISVTKRPNRLVASLKGLVFIICLFAIVVLVQSQTRQWLLSQWANGLAELPVGEQIERLLQINQLGDIATETITRRIAAENDSVAETAVELIRERQSSWATRPDNELAAAHMQMLAGIEAVAEQLPAKRIVWVTQLINQTLIECVDQRGEAMSKTYQAASELLSKVADRTSDPGTSESMEMPSLVPLPVRMQALDAVADRANDVVSRVQPAPPETVAAISAQPIPDEPQIIPRSTAAAKTQTHPEAMNASVANDDRPAVEIRPASIRGVEKMPLQTFSTRSVIGLLGSNQAATRDQAVEELVRRGLSNEEIRIANQLAAPQMEVRLGLLESIVRRSDIDPRPWLLWLAEDNSREVRVRAVTALQAMNDSAVSATLRKRLTVEDDPTVIALLKQLTERR